MSFPLILRPANEPKLLLLLDHAVRQEINRFATENVDLVGGDRVWFRQGPVDISSGRVYCLTVQFTARRLFFIAKVGQ